MFKYLCILCVLAYANTANAVCFWGTANERLSTYCLLKTIGGKIVDEQTINFTNNVLISQGFDALIPNTRSTQKKHNFDYGIYPTIQYDENANGGNPTGDLVVGSLVFEGQDELEAKPSILLGLSAFVQGRVNYQRRSYIDYTVALGGSRATSQGVNVQNYSTRLCVKRNLHDWWYAEACAQRSGVYKEISEDRNSSITASLSRVTSSSMQGFNMYNVGAGIKRTDLYNQKQVYLGYHKLYPSRYLLETDISLGEPVINHLALRHRAVVTLSVPVKGETLSFHAEYMKEDGGSLFGVSRADNTYMAALKYPLFKGVLASVGFKSVSSSIEYFDINTPIISLTLPPLKF